MENEGPRIRCEKCPAEATTASVIGEAVRKHAAYRRQRAERDTWKPINLAELLAGDFPYPAHWHITCDEHYPGDDVVSYWLQLHRGRRSFVDLLRHVAEKNWAMEDTQFVEFAIALLAPDEAKLPRGVAW